MFKRTLKALFALFFGQVLTRFGSFILVPLFVKYWTPTVYGEWLTLSATVAYIASLDFGVNQAAINKLTQTYATGNISEYKSIQNSALKFFMAVAVIGFIMIAAVLGFIPINNLLGITKTSPTEATYTLLILGAYILTSLPARMVFSIYQTTGNLAKTQWIQNVQSILSLVFTILILIYGYGMLYVAVMQFVMQITAIIYVLVDTKLKHSELYPGIKYADKNIMKDLFKPGLLFTLIIIANILWMQGSLILISTTLGGLMVATFSVTRTLSLLPRQIVSIFQSALFPDIAIVHSKKEYSKLRSIHRLLIILPSGLAIIFFSVFWFSGTDIISLWTLGEINTDTILLQLLLILVLLQTPYLSSATVTLATNQHKVFTILFFISQLTGLLLSIVFINIYGIIIIPISFIISEAVFCYYLVIKDTCQKIKEKPLHQIIDSTKNMVILTILSLSICWLIFISINISLIINIIAGIVVTTILVGSYIWIFWFTIEEKLFVKDKIRELKF